MTPSAFDEPTFGPMWRGSAPLIVWALHFFALYVLVAAGCNAGWADVPLLGTSVLRVLLASASVAALCWIAWLLWHADGGRPRDTAGLLAVAMAGTAWLSLVAVAWASVPALLLPLCSTGSP